MPPLAHRGQGGHEMTHAWLLHLFPLFQFRLTPLKGVPHLLRSLHHELA